MTDSTETINLQNAMEQIVQKQNYEHYDVWLKNFSLNKHETIKKSINTFLKSKDYLLARKSF